MEILFENVSSKNLILKILLSKLCSKNLEKNSKQTIRLTHFKEERIHPKLMGVQKEKTSLTLSYC